MFWFYHQVDWDASGIPGKGALGCANGDNGPVDGASRDDQFGRRLALAPVLDLEFGHALEFAGVVRNEHNPETTRVRRDEQIVCANHRPAILEIGPNLAIVESRFTWVIEDLNVPQEDLNARLVTNCVGRYFNPVHQLRLRSRSD